MHTTAKNHTGRKSVGARGAMHTRRAKVVLSDVVFTKEGVPRLTVHVNATPSPCDTEPDDMQTSPPNTCTHPSPVASPITSPITSPIASPQPSLSPHPSPHPSPQPSPQSSPHSSPRVLTECASDSDDSEYESCADMQVGTEPLSITERLSRLDIFIGRLHDRSQRAFDELVNAQSMHHGVPFDSPMQ